MPGPIPKEAIRYLRSLKIAYDDPDAWDAEQERAFRITGLAKEDLLQYFRDTLATSLEKGTTFREWVKQLKPQLERSGWRGATPSRLELIFETNMRVSRAAGQWTRIEDTADTMPYLEYIEGPVVTKHRDSHIPFFGLILRWDDPFWNTHYPPSGFSCRCSVRQISESEARSRGVSKSPKLKQVTWRSPDGRTIVLPEGVEPGWDHNPGKEPNRGL